MVSKKNDSDESDSSSRLLILCCTANMGNAQPTASGLEAWVPKNGAIPSVTALDSASQAEMKADGDGGGAASSMFDIIMVGMQEATWKTKKKVNGGGGGMEEEGAADEEDYDEYDETERSAAAADLATPAAAAPVAVTTEEAAKRDEMKKKWSSASFIKKMTSAEDSKYMRTLLQENLGSAYNMIQEYQRGQMRLYLFVKQSLVHEISHLDIKAENTGIGRVYSNKGGIVVQFTIRQTRLAFFTAHLAAHEGESHYQTRNADVKEILRGCKPSSKAVPPHLANIYDASLACHHMFVMGDLNYRTRVPASPIATAYSSVESSSADAKKAEHAATVQRILDMVLAGDFKTLYSYDELSAGIRDKDVLCNFQTLPCHFNPTFKMLRAEGFQYKQQRVPSYTDRILYTSADDLQSNLTPLAYEPCPGFITSDHKPIRGAFAIQTNGSSTKKASSTDTMTEPLSITFSNMKCSNLPSMDIDGSSDPYIMFVCDPVDLVKDDRDPKDTKRTIQKQLGNAAKIKWPCTSYIAKNLNPTWGDETVKLCIPPTPASHMKGALLYVTVMDYDLSTQDDILCTLPLNIAKLVSLPSSEKEKTIVIDSPLLKYGEELGRIQCTIHVQRGGIEYHGQRSAKFGLCSCFG